MGAVMDDRPQEAQSQQALARVLVPLARREIAQALDLPAVEVDLSLPRLHEAGATFVTLTRQGSLRGCIGSLQAYRPLLQDIRANAHAAAFRDPRFAPLQPEELATTGIEVSLLSAMQPLQYRDEQEAWAQLRVGEDGVVFEFGSQRSTFLPQVWEQLPAVSDFMARLKQKAGLPATFWHADVRLHRYTVQKFREADAGTDDAVDQRRVTA